MKYYCAWCGESKSKAPNKLKKLVRPFCCREHYYKFIRRCRCKHADDRKLSINEFERYCEKKDILIAHKCVKEKCMDCGDRE